MLDLVLAIAHHLLVFGLCGILFSELVLVRKGMDVATVGRVARMDLVYGALAGLIIAVGFARAAMAAKGWAFYSNNAFFWAKVGNPTQQDGRQRDPDRYRGGERSPLPPPGAGAVRAVADSRRRHGPRLRAALTARRPPQKIYAVVKSASPNSATGTPSSQTGVNSWEWV